MTTEKPQRSSKHSHWQASLLIALVGSIPLKPGMKLRRILYRTIFAKVGRGVQIQPGAEFVCPSHVELEDCVLLHRDVRIRSRETSNSIIRLKEWAHIDRGVDIKIHYQGEIEIGSHTYIGPYSCLSGRDIKIGDYCLIASHSGIYANNHVFDDPTRKIVEQKNSYKGIVIEDNCWLGTGVKVLDGIRIGQGSVIGAGAVVTKSIPPYSIAVGVPAKVIAKRDGTGKHPVESEVLQTVSSTKS